MDEKSPTPAATSTVSSSSSSISGQAPPPIPLQFLEVSIISAQDLSTISKSTRTYAVVWINPEKKQNTRTDSNHTHPTWNDKFTFRIDNDFLYSRKSAIHVEIYTISWFRDILVGTVKVLLRDVLAKTRSKNQNKNDNTKFIALQVRRPSGTPQGILNMGVSVLDNSLRSMLLQPLPDNDEKTDDPTKNENQDDENIDEDKKIQLWRSRNAGSEANNDEFPLQGGSVCNGSMVNGSEVCSDIGPSASIVAADIAMKTRQQLQQQQPPRIVEKHVHKTIHADETGSMIVEELTLEEAEAKGYKPGNIRDKWRKALDDGNATELSSVSKRHSRRNSDGGKFSCFGAVYGIEFGIVCGPGNPNNAKKKTKPVI